MVRKHLASDIIPIGDQKLPSHADYAVTLHAIERDLKAITEKVESLRYTLLAKDNGPNDLFTILSGNTCQFLTVQELSRILKVDRRTVYGLRNQGLPSHRVGKELRFDPLEVAGWLKTRHQA